MEIGEIITYFEEGDYMIERELGHGAFATVYSVNMIKSKTVSEYISDQILKNVACKIVCKNKIKTIHQKESISREITFHRKLSHPNIIRLYNVKESPEYIFMLMERCDISLWDLLLVQNYFTEDICIKYLKQLLEAIYYLHNSMNIIHRDIKPANIIVCGDNIKLADFGFVNNRINEKLRMAGTPIYMSPENVLSNNIGYQSDIWSVGVTFYVLLFGARPFVGDTTDEVFQNIKTLNYKFPELNIVSNNTFSVNIGESKQIISVKSIQTITSILQLDPNERPTAFDLLERYRE